MLNSTAERYHETSCENETPHGREPLLFMAKSVATLFVANSTVDTHRAVYAQIKNREEAEPLNRGGELEENIIGILKGRNVSQPTLDSIHPYWNPNIEYNPMEVFGTLIQFLDYHDSQIPKTVLPPERDMEKYIDAIFQKEGFVTIDQQLDELLTITNNNLVGAINLGFIAARFMGRGMDTKAYPGIAVTDERMLLWGQKMAQFELYDGKGDSTGDTYYFWTHAFAALYFKIHEKNQSVYQLIFEHGTEIMKFVRQRIARLPITSDHYEASLLGRSIGLALAEPDWYPSSVPPANSMVDGGSENPYLKRVCKTSRISEVPVAVLRLGRSIGQRLESTPQSAQEWLDGAIDIGVENGVFSESARKARIERKVGSGFNTSIFLFNADEREWVLKIGAQQAPVPGWFNPSSPEYAQWYAGNLEIFHNHFEHTLPQLVPWPQYVMYAENHRNERTTLVVQPYIADITNLEKVSLMGSSVREAILNELVAFYDQCQILHGKYNFIPDLGSENNTVLRPVGNQWHLALLDCGMIDFKAMSPVLNGWSRFVYHRRLKTIISDLSRTTS